MDLCRVRYFLAVCEYGSFTAAAKACDVTQPSVTTGVRRLERAVGGKLFERRHPVRLTPLGTALRPLLQRMQDTAHLVTASVAEHATGKGKDKRQIDLERAVNNLFGRSPPQSDRPPARASHREQQTSAAAALLAFEAVRGGDGQTKNSDQAQDPDRTRPTSEPSPQSLLVRSRFAIRRANDAIDKANAALARGKISLS